MHLTQCSGKFRMRQQNEWRLPVDRPYGGICSCSVNDACRQRHRPIGLYGSVKKAFNRPIQFKLHPFHQTQPVHYRKSIVYMTYSAEIDSNIAIMTENSCLNDNAKCQSIIFSATKTA